MIDECSDDATWKMHGKHVDNARVKIWHCVSKHVLRNFVNPWNRFDRQQFLNGFNNFQTIVQWHIKDEMEHLHDRGQAQFVQCVRTLRCSQKKKKTSDEADRFEQNRTSI